MRTAFFDCFCGASGDMILGALIDGGADFTHVTAQISRLGLGDYDLDARKVNKAGIAATKFTVSISERAQPHRHLKHIVELIRDAMLAPRVQQQAMEIFTNLARAEARVHNTTIEKVHFHEVGAIDAIIDIVGTCLALESLGIEQVTCSPVPAGSGTIQCEHGILPIPAPATAELLKGIPMAQCEEPGELTTPTGAAILATLSSAFGPMPSMIPEAIGYGAGTREGKTRPNVMRIIIGERHATDAFGIETVLELETNLDDCSPHEIGHCFERLFAEGALDVWTQPILMKKQRMGTLLGVLCRPQDGLKLEQVIFHETGTLGIRRSYRERSILERTVELIETRFGPIRIKIGRFPGSETAMPEYDDCHAAALRFGLPLRAVMAEARAAWNAKNRQGPN